MQFRNSKPKKPRESEKGSNIVSGEPQAASNHYSNLSLGDSQKRMSSTREQVQSLIYQGKVCSLEDSVVWEFQKLNRKAVKSLDQGMFQDAEVSLNIAQQILEQAGSHGKNIDFTYIITLFHNQICLYQQSWQLQVCVSYVEAIIFNLKCQIQKNEKQKSSSVQDLIELKGVLAHYYLLFCAFNSQLKQHDSALIAAKRSNTLLKEYFRQVSTNLSTNNKYTQLKQNMQQLQWISTFISNLQKPALLQITNDLLSLKRSKVLHNKYGFYELSEQFRNYTIAQIMELEPILSFTLNKTSFLNKSNLLLKIILFSISYFTKATQLRLIAKKVLSEGLQLRHISQYKQSQCHHLNSIIILLYFVPFDLVYLQHLLQSFKLHYSIELVKSQYSIQTCKSYKMVTEKMKRMFLQVEAKKNEHCSTSKPTNHVVTSKANKKDKLIIKNDVLRNTHIQYLSKEKRLSTNSLLSALDKQSKNTRLKSKKTQLKKAYMTSVQSPNKLSSSNTPRRLSPKASSRYQVEQSQRVQFEVRKQSKNKKAQIISEYFDSAIICEDGIKQQKQKMNKENKLRHIDISKVKTLNKQDYSKGKKTPKKQTQKRRKDEDLKTVKSTSSLSRHFK